MIFNWEVIAFLILSYASLFEGQTSVLHTNTGTLFIRVLLNSYLGTCSGMTETNLVSLKKIP